MTALANPVPVYSMGRSAATVLQRCGTAGRATVGTVIAAFQRSVYIDTPHGMLCVGLRRIGRGPMNILLGSSARQLPFALNVGDAIDIRGARLWLPRGHCLDTVDASVFDESVRTMPVASVHLRRRRRELAALDTVPVEGFGGLLTPSDTGLPDSHLGKTSPVSAAQRGLLAYTGPTIHRLHRWLCTPPRADAGPVPPLNALLGAGPGLTPSGDDLLAGVMLALYALDHADRARRLWLSIDTGVQRHTNAISAAHLALAAQAHCAEPVLQLLERLFGSRCFDTTQTIRLLQAIGSTSGWDTLAGIALVIDAEIACRGGDPVLDDRPCVPTHSMLTVNAPC